MLMVLEWVMLVLLSLVISFILYQIICMVFNTYKMCRIIKRLEKIVEISKVMVLSGIGQNLKDKEKLTLNSTDGPLTICKNNNGAKIDGLEIDFQKDILAQLEPIFNELTYIISSYISLSIIKNFLLGKCKKIESSARQLQELISINEMEGVKA